MPPDTLQFHLNLMALLNWIYFHRTSERNFLMDPLIRFSPLNESERQNNWANYTNSVEQCPLGFQVSFPILFLLSKKLRRRIYRRRRRENKIVWCKRKSFLINLIPVKSAMAFSFTEQDFLRICPELRKQRKERTEEIHHHAAEVM